MWLNKNYNSQAESFAKKGTVTLGGTANVDAGEGTRNAEAGTKAVQSNLKNGEIKICSLSGAYILLRSDGSVVINGAVIDKNGKITEKN